MTAKAERVGLVTGASRGIGRAIALALAGNGVHVVGLARSMQSLETLAREIAEGGGSFTPLAFDVADWHTASEVALQIDRDWQRLDVLVGNAAILGPVSPVSSVMRSDFEAVVATNLTANWSLLASLDGLLCRSEAGRALFITAGAPREPFPNISAYAASKAGLEALVKTYALERRETRVRANLFNPGPVRTDMRAAAVPNDNPDLLPTPDQLANNILAMLSAEFTDTGVVFDFPTRSFV